ncbi:MAG: biotin--[acetyl-CoA-carboxylase] ligase [Pseudomonadota bacterium]|nr:biotin--[acetyl-CoA-carboxylase] ligase [Pseudomonadota bacterium]
MGRRLASGAALEVFASLDSTSLEARRRIEAGRRDSVFIVALEQTAGYGRRGTAWTQGAGDFAGTLVFEERAPREAVGQLSFVSALAVAETVSHFAPRADPSLKWPNDVLAGGGKLAGILLELLENREASATVALGVGINIVSKPALADYPAARLIDYLGGASAPTPTEVATALDDAFERWRRIWRAEGFAPIRAAWLGKAAKLGDPVRVRLPDGEVSGVFRDLDPSGSLVLDCDGKRRLIAAGAILSGRGA